MRTERVKNKKPKIVMPTGHPERFWNSAFRTAVFLFLIRLAVAVAQEPPQIMKGFRAPLEYFDPPHELQVKSFLESAEAEPQSDGLILLRDAKLQTYHEDGSREMTVTAPQCVYDPRRDTVNSPGPLRVQTFKEENKLDVEGQGFFWQRTNSVLIISNRQQTTIRGSLTNSLTP